ncbi:MAG: M15 family metallopeptidase [Treponema sp.]|nr:M15 family metallopeptidase [Treponema sp.]
MKKKYSVMLLLFVFFSKYAFAQNSGISANGELVLQALQNSFPNKVSDVVFTDNDWTVKVGGETFYWAGGRLLPKSEKNNIDSYSPYMFYLVPDKAAAPSTFSPQFIESLRSRGSTDARRERKDTHREFHAKLYGASDKDGIEALIEKADFLGFKVSVHIDIIEALERLDKEIRKLTGAKDFISSLGSIAGYNWREISGTQRMSYHSWGLAIDIQPKKLEGKAIYWLWEQGRNKDWMLVPLEKRWSPPEAVIRAFEREGFIWGGKWPLYDNMHFEYRPELHELNRLLAVNPISNTDNNSSSIDLHHIYPEPLIANN